MTKLKQIIKEHKIGQAIFEQLFKLSDKQLKKKLLTIIDDEHNQDILKAKDNGVTRIIKNEIPQSIEIWHYSGIMINSSGISYKSEYGLVLRTIVKFNEHFKL